MLAPPIRSGDGRARIGRTLVCRELGGLFRVYLFTSGGQAGRRKGWALEWSRQLGVLG